MSTTRTATATPTHDARHCGHVGRSESPTVKRAAILAECLRTVEGFALPEGEPVAVLAVVEAILAGVPCDLLGYVSDLSGWHGMATEWADLHGDAWLTLPGGTMTLLRHAAASVSGTYEAPTGGAL